ncbi:MAG TPA: efflux RND transporter periplasmic adaptor subunit, partial [Erythrobacter sp.]|nr:efflux RND transporter periplasmic adaptor subunit [Erythrobacter sp.]
MLRIFVSLIFTCLIAGCDNAPVPEEADRRPVKLYTVATGGQARTYEFPAIIEASTSSDLTFDVPGKIVRLTVDQGDFVRAGTVIAQLDQTIARNQLVQAREQYEAAQDAFRRADALVGEG